MKTAVIPWSCALLLACAQAQEPKQPQATPPSPQQVLDEMKAQFAKEGITLDAKEQTVAVKSVVNSPPDPIEYLLIHRKGKRHEAIFVTKAKPSVLNAALLLIGLQQGKNATYTEKDPPPTEKEMQDGADPLIVKPPEGMPFWMTVRWTTPEGKKEEHCVEDFILHLANQKPVDNCSWVYLGGRMAKIYRNDPEVYVADMEGNLISVCYLSPDNHLGTMVHADARDDQMWWTTTLLPPPDTEVDFVFHRVEPPIHVERGKRLKQEAAAAKEPAKEAEKPKEPGSGK